MRTQKALVTGATGCLGRHLAAKLIAAGWHVRASGRDAAIGSTLQDAGAEFIAGDLLEAGLAQRLAEDVDVIFHCAALSSPWGRRAAFQAVNVDGTQALVDAAQLAGAARFVHVSSPSIYFTYQDAFDIPETAPLPRRFVNAYASSKAEAERVVMRAAEQGLSSVILRPRGIFGEFDTALAPRLMRFAASGRVPLLRGGRALVDVTYAGNVADAMMLAARPHAATGTFNISNGEPLTVHDLLTRTFGALNREVRFAHVPYRLLDLAAAASEQGARLLGGREPRLLRYTLGVMAYSQTLDITAARNHLGYEPRVSIDEGLTRYAAWLRGEAHPLAAIASAAAATPAYGGTA